jgi:nucleotide-binding universal stress UspA family protein
MIDLKKILVAVDFSKESTLAAKFAVSLAQEFKSKLYVLHAFTPLHAGVAVEMPDFESYQREIIKKTKEDLRLVIPEKIKEMIEVEELIEIGPAYHVIVEKAQDLDVDVIVLATQGRTGLAHMLLGSVAEKVVRHAPCPVFAIRNPKDKFVHGWE